ncbi:MAG: sulfotransferase [Desulfobaccales bacterium]
MTKPPDRLNGSMILHLINAAGRRFVGNGLKWLSLDEQLLLDRACEGTGLDDFGDDSFREGLRVLLRSYELDAEFSFVGRICVNGDTVRLLSNRLRLVADRRRHPGIAAEVIRRPLFITGLPRSGTTFLHALLAQDPAHRAPQVWEVMHPSPPPEKASYATDPRIATTDRQLKWVDILMPDFKKVHMIGARLPQECIAITSHDFRSYSFETMAAVHSYRAWHDRQDKRPEYEFHRQFLQHLQWRCPGQRWVLKAPGHLLALEALLQVYPDACVLMTHRDPLKVLASCASFTEVLRSAFSDRVDKVSMARQVGQRWEEGAGLAVKYRQAGNLGGQLFDVQYLELVRDPISMARRIYEHFDLELTAAAETAMQRFLAENPQNKGGVHRYSLEEFGFNREEERRRFQAYLDCFGIEPES